MCQQRSGTNVFVHQRLSYSVDHNGIGSASAFIHVSWIDSCQKKRESRFVEGQGEHISGSFRPIQGHVDTRHLFETFPIDFFYDGLSWHRCFHPIRTFFFCPRSTYPTTAVYPLPVFQRNVLCTACTTVELSPCTFSSAFFT